MQKIKLGESVPKPDSRFEGGNVYFSTPVVNALCHVIDRWDTHQLLTLLSSEMCPSPLLRRQPCVTEFDYYDSRGLIAHQHVKMTNGVITCDYIPSPYN